MPWPPPPIRVVAGALGVWLWWWGVDHWPLPPDAYGPGFWAWAAAFPILILASLPRPRWRWPRITAAGWLALAIVCVAAALRFYRVDTVPFAIHFDEVNGFSALEAMQQGTAENIFSRIDAIPSNPGLLVGMDWLWGCVAPNRFVAHRYAAASFGTLSIIVTYLLARRLYSGTVAVIAGFTLACSSWHIEMSRFQSFFQSTPFAAALMWWALSRALDGRTADAVLAGLVMGLGLMMYNPIKVMLIAVPVWWLWHAVVTAGFARRTMLPLAVVSVVAAMVLTPLEQSSGWEGYFGRAQEVTILGPEFRAALFGGDAGAGHVLLGQMQRMSRVLRGGAEVAADDWSREPLLNYAELAAAALGLLMCAWRLRSWRATIPVIWLVLTIGAVALSSVPEASYRLAVALPALALLIGIGLATPVEWLRRVLPRRVALVVTVAAILGGLALGAYDIRINGPRVLRHLHRRNRAHEFDTLARVIAAGPAQPAYYYEATPSQFEHNEILALTRTHTTLNVPNVVDEVPRLVDRNRPAVFLISYLSAAHSVAYLRWVYPEATVEPVRDPSGFLAGYRVSVPAGAGRLPSPSDGWGCGLRRVQCGNEPPVVDYDLSFLDLHRLCGGEAASEIVWRGVLSIPDPPPEQLGLLQQSVAASIELDGAAVLTDGAEPSLALAPRIGPGPHAITVRAAVGDGSPTVMSLWWQMPGHEPTVIPCQAFAPVPP